MRAKYTGTLIGFVFALPGLITFLGEDILVFSFIPILSQLPIAFPLELIGSKLFESYEMSVIFELTSLAFIFGITSFHFIKHLIKDSQENRTINLSRFLGYFGVQLIIVHPLIFCIWALGNSVNSGDGQFIFGTIETFPTSSALFIVLGLIIDFVVKNKTFANTVLAPDSSPVSNSVENT